MKPSEMLAVSKEYQETFEIFTKQWVRLGWELIEAVRKGWEDYKYYPYNSDWQLIKSSCSVEVYLDEDVLKLSFEHHDRESGYHEVGYILITDDLTLEGLVSKFTTFMIEHNERQSVVEEQKTENRIKSLREELARLENRS